MNSNVILIILCVVLAVVLLLIWGFLPSKVKKALLVWVVDAEKQLGGGTGNLKLRYVYDLFVKQFPVFSRIVPFTVFSKWVDEWALPELNALIEANPKIKKYIYG